MRYLYKIYTENKATNEEIVAKHFNNFTLTYTRGYYKGIEESSMAIEIVGDETAKDTVKSLAEEIKTINEQDSVLITWHQVEAILI